MSHEHLLPINRCTYQLER